MRRALKQPAILFEWFEPHEEADHPALTRALARDRWQSPVCLVLRPLKGVGFALISCWDSGEEAVRRRQEAVLRASWGAWAASLACQPQVHLLLQCGVVWPQIERAELVLITTDPSRLVRAAGGRAPRGCPQREALPVLDGAWVWPVIGHPGRLLVCLPGEAVSGEGTVKGVIDALERQWGPLAEDPERWRVSLEMDSPWLQDEGVTPK